MYGGGGDGGGSQASDRSLSCSLNKSETTGFLSGDLWTVSSCVCGATDSYF